MSSEIAEWSNDEILKELKSGSGAGVLSSDPSVYYRRVMCAALHRILLMLVNEPTGGA